MGLLTTNHFCCCFSLRTGGLIVGYFGLASAILGITSATAVQSTLGAQLSLPCLVLSMCWLYGIHERKPAWLLLNVILCIISLMLCLLIFTIFSTVVIFLAYEEMYPSKNKLPYDFPFILLFHVWLALITVFKWHLTSAAYSLYKSMKAEEVKRSKFDSYFISNLTQQFSTIKCKPIIV